MAVADLHIGSRVGLADPAVSGATDPANDVRQVLYDRWCRAARGPWRKPDALIVVGDAIEGQNRNRGALGTWTSDLLEQADHAAELLAMWKAKQIYVIRGSGYHVEADGSGLCVEEYVARKLSAEPHPDGGQSGWHWFLTADGVTFHVQHKISVVKANFAYRPTPLSRELLYLKLLGAIATETGEVKARVCLRAHAHYYCHVEHTTQHGFNLPAWKGLDEFMSASGALAISPDLGFVGFECHNGELRYEKHLFRLADAQPPPHTFVGRRMRGRARARA